MSYQKLEIIEAHPRNVGSPFFHLFKIDKFSYIMLNITVLVLDLSRSFA